MLPIHAVVSHSDSAVLHQVVLRGNPDVQVTNMDVETVLLALSTGTQTIGDIHSVLCHRFDVAPERALDDLVILVNQLIQEGLLQQERKEVKNMTKETYVQPAVAKHQLLRDITTKRSGYCGPSYRGWGRN